MSDEASISADEDAKVIEVRPKRPGVTFHIDEEEQVLEPETVATPQDQELFKRPSPSTLSITSAKFGLLCLIALRLLIRIFVSSYELARVVSLEAPDLINFPLMHEASWLPYRSDLIKHLVCLLIRHILEDGLLFVIIYKDLICTLWFYLYGVLTKFFGEKRVLGKWVEFLRAMLFVQCVVIGWLAKEYALGLFMYAVHAGANSYKTAFWPHQEYKFFGLWLLAIELGSILFLAGWEWLSDFKYFSVVSAAVVFFGHLLVLLIEPTQGILRLRYGTKVEAVDPDTHLYDILTGLSKLCSYPLANFYIILNSATRNVRSCGYKTFSAVIIDSALIDLLEYVSPRIKEIFPETSGPDDADQMLLAAVAHDIGHAMTGQMLWYSVLGYGTFYALLTWFVLDYFMKRPILFRSFGFRLWPIPPGCALLIILVALSVLRQAFYIPLSNAIQWMCELEADSYAASQGFGPSLHKYLYAIQASGLSLNRAFTTLYAIYTNFHPPYWLRAKMIEA